MRDWMLKMAEAYGQMAYLTTCAVIHEHGTTEEAMLKCMFFLWAAEQV